MNTENEQIPEEILDLTRFLCRLYNDIDNFVYSNCTGEQIGKYPVVQGTRNQLNLRKIGQQEYKKENIQKAVEWMLKNK